MSLPTPAPRASACTDVISPVERAGHVIGRSQRFGVDPENTEAALVGHAEEAGEDERRRQRHAAHDQRALLAVDQRVQPRTGFQAMRRGKGYGHPARQRRIGQRPPG